jgi:uracil-DNA glycosylase family 4
MEKLLRNEWNNLNDQITTCRLCPRLVARREDVARVKRKAFATWDYWGKPVPGFGDYSARMLVVGLAPGAHGSNRTGRMFTGDGSGNFLFPTLFANEFVNQPYSINRDDGLVLKDIFITAVCRCVPPSNRPEMNEIQNCLPFLAKEKSLLKSVQGVVALGSIAYHNAVRLFLPERLQRLAPDFSHGVFIPSDESLPWILGSYHPSRQNTQTGRLTQDMFDAIWKKTRTLMVDKHIV